MNLIDRRLTTARAVIEEAEAALHTCTTNEIYRDNCNEICGGQQFYSRNKVTDALASIREWKENTK